MKAVAKPSSSKPLAVVTGGNRGIGQEICRQLAAHGMQVVLTARDPKKGAAAAKAMKAEGLDVTFRKLDVTDPRSIAGLVRWLRQGPKRCDVLVNNAGIYLDVIKGLGVTKDWQTESAFDCTRNKLRTTLATNLEGPFFLMQAILPLMQERGYGRIVNVSSGSGQLTDMGGHEASYRISKTARKAPTCIFGTLRKGQGLLVNEKKKRWVQTDMGGPGAKRTVAEGADTAVWLATLPAGGPTGGYFRDRSIIPW